MENELLLQLRASDTSPQYYQYYPRLFHKYFDDIDKEIVQSISYAGYYYYQSILFMDSMIDERKSSHFIKILHLQEETIKILTSIYGLNSKFWEYWNLRKHEFYEAAKIEKKIRNEQCHFDWDIYKDIADKKSAFGKIAIDSLYLLSKKNDAYIYDLLLKSHAYFSIGFQLYDDLKDFKDDFEKKQFNWAIHKLSKAIDFGHYQYEANTLNKLLYIKDIDLEILDKSIFYFKKAAEVLHPLKIDSEWACIIDDMKNTIIQYKDITIGYKREKEKKIEISNQVPIDNKFFTYTSVDPVIIKGLDYIKKDYLNNYSDLKHVMYLSDIEDFDNDSQIHVSDTFQRAILNECFITIANRLNLDISEFIETEISYLISRSNKDDIGGWSYFPSVKEIAADIDDLAQIIILLVESNRIDYVDKYCKKAIHVALNNKSNINGGIGTWIIPNKNMTSIQVKQDIFNRTKWGNGPDNEVVANFVYSLYKYNFEAYTNEIDQSINYILANQHKDGFWKSKWYFGNYYGTYISLRLLKMEQKKYFTYINTALKYIINQQNTDGGFGLNNKSSDALSTALALLCLKLYADISNETIRLKAEDYLINTQNKDGSWKDINFIKPKVQEPYKSKTLTTAFVLKSLV